MDPLLSQRMACPFYKVTLLEFCLKNPYFLFQGTYYEQAYGATMGFPISPLIINLFMEEFKVKAISSVPQIPFLLLRSIDDTFVIQWAKHNHQLLQHINSQDRLIQFTMEDPREDGALPFLDTLVSKVPTTS